MVLKIYILLVSFFVLISGDFISAQIKTDKELAAKIKTGTEAQSTGQMTIAGDCFIEVTEYIAKKYGDKSSEYAVALYNLGGHCQQILQPDMAYILLYYSFMILSENNTDSYRKSLKDTQEIVQATVTMGNVLRKMANLECISTIQKEKSNTEELYLTAMRYYQISGAVNRYYIDTMHELAGFYIRQGKYDMALQQFLKAQNENSSMDVLSKEEKFALKNDIAFCYLMTGKLQQADDILKELIIVNNDEVSTQSLSYGLVLNNAMNLSIMRGDKKMALYYLKKVVKIYPMHLPGWSEVLQNVTLPECIIKLNHSARLFEEKKMPEISAIIYKYVNSLTKIITLSNLIHANAENILWNTLKPCLDEIKSFAFRNHMPELMYETSQINKFMFYGYFSDKRSSDLYEHTFVRETKEKIDSLQQLQIDLNDTIYDKYLQSVSLTVKRTNLANDMLNELHEKEIHSYGWPRKWKETAQMLSDKEAVIDFVSYPETQQNNNLRYCALIFDKKSVSPQMISLCTENELSEILNMPIENMLSTLYKVIWQPIEHTLNNYTHLYLSVDGNIGNIPFAGIKKGNNNYIGDEYILYTLSYLENIAYIKANRELQMKDIKNIFLFGGADFGLHPDKINSATRGQGFAYLPGSKREIDQLGTQLSENLNICSYSGKEATENQFKTLSYKQQSPNIVHISTHGFFTPFTENSGTGPVNRPFSKLNGSLSRCGIALSGANRALKEPETGNSASNGIVTGYEISALNLSRTELTVLSACHSGREESNRVDMARGLQRAFSHTGTHSLMAGLWEIPDKETVEFMTEFYSQWATGITKRQAFTNAQQKMRTKYPYEPEKWAGFILME